MLIKKQITIIFYTYIWYIIIQELLYIITLYFSDLIQVQISTR